MFSRILSNMFLVDALIQLDSTIIDSMKVVTDEVETQIIQKSFIGAVGGLTLSIYNFVYQSNQLPSLLKSEYIIIHFILWPSIGFLISWIFLMDKNVMSWFLCFQTGLTAPAIIQGLLNDSNATVNTSDDA